jgi:hypothetical protein
MAIDYEAFSKGFKQSYDDTLAKDAEQAKLLKQKQLEKQALEDRVLQRSQGFENNVYKLESGTPAMSQSIRELAITLGDEYADNEKLLSERKIGMDDYRAKNQQLWLTFHQYKAAGEMMSSKHSEYAKDLKDGNVSSSFSNIRRQEVFSAINAGDGKWGRDENGQISLKVAVRKPKTDDTGEDVEELSFGLNELSTNSGMFDYVKKAELETMSKTLKGIYATGNPKDGETYTLNGVSYIGYSKDKVMDGLVHDPDLKQFVSGSLESIVEDYMGKVYDPTKKEQQLEEAIDWYAERTYDKHFQKPMSKQKLPVPKAKKPGGSYTYENTTYDTFWYPKLQDFFLEQKGNIKDFSGLGLYTSAGAIYLKDNANPIAYLNESSEEKLHKIAIATKMMKKTKTSRTKAPI